jgi:hypothetical protein
VTVPAVDQPVVPGEVSLGGKRYWVEGGVVRERKATQFAPPIRTGNPERSDQQFRSEVIWDDLTGGIGVINMDERQTPDRFSDSSLNTLIKGYWTLPPKVRTIALPAALTSAANVHRFAGAVSHDGYVYTMADQVPVRVGNLASPTVEYYDSAGSAWATSGGTVYVHTDYLSADPVVWKGDVWFPCGFESTGSLLRYDVSAQTFSAVVDSSAAKIPAVRLAVFDEDLYIVKYDGSVYTTNDNATTVTLTARGSVDTFSVLNGLVPHRNFAGDPAPWLASEGRLVMHDPAAGKVYPVGIDFPDKNPNNGRGLTVWDGDVWFGKGANVHQVVNGARIVRGPNVGDGLLKEMQGHVLDIDPSFDNYLVYAISGGQTHRTSSIMAYNRKGHHVLVKSAPSAGTGGTDDFTRADSALTMDGTGKTWAEGPGTWGITGNKAYCVTSAGTKNQAVASGKSLSGDYVGTNQSVQVTLSTNATGAQVIFRSDGNGATGTYYAIETYSAGYQLVRYVAGTPTVLQKMPTTAASGDVIKVDAYGYSYAVYVNGTLLHRGSLPALHHSMIFGGIGTNGTTTPRFDDFSITSLTQPTEFVHYHASNQSDVPGVLLFNGGANTATQGTLLQYVKLFDTTDNPNQFLSTDYESSGSVTLPWFDAGLGEVQKTGLSVQIRTLDCSATETVTVSYALDDSTSFTTLYKSDGTQSAITSDGVTTLYFDADQLGTYFYKVRLKVALASGSASLSPKVVFVKITYVRELDTLYAYDFFLDLSRPQPDGRPPLAAIADLRADVANRKLVKFAYNPGQSDDTKTCLILNYAGPMTTGPERAMKAQLALAEV